MAEAFKAYYYCGIGLERYQVITSLQTHLSGTRFHLPHGTRFHLPHLTQVHVW